MTDEHKNQNPAVGKGKTTKETHQSLRHSLLKEFPLNNLLMETRTSDQAGLSETAANNKMNTT